MNNTTLFGIDKGAALSDCGKYRFTLWRKWDKMKPQLMFIGLNPSTADANIDDATIRRCIRFVNDWGYGGFYMLNLFAFRATDPADMKREINPVGELNDNWLRHTGKNVNKVVFAWGANGNFLNRDKEVIAMFPNAYCMGKTKDGHPKHPLYLSSHTLLELF